MANSGADWSVNSDRDPSQDTDGDWLKDSLEFSLSPIGQHDPTAQYPNGYMEYKPYSIVNPLFVSFGVARKF